MAGVGVSWYTWLEQGREINPSPEVLDALAQALRLDTAERRTLFALARTELPLADDVAAADPEQRDSDIRQLIALVDSLHPNPAYLLGPMTRILAWNEAASVVLGSIDHLAPDRRYLLWWLMVDPGEGGMTAQREGTARNTLARFRAEYARHAGEQEYEEFLAQIRVAVRPRLIAVTRSIHSQQLAGRALALSKLRRHERHLFPQLGKLHPFFRITALSISLSRLRSATSCFSRRFSSSICRSRAASLTSMPPNFDFHP